MTRTTVVITMFAVFDTMTTVKMAGIAIKTLKTAIPALFPAGGGQKATVVTPIRQIADGRLCLVAAPEKSGAFPAGTVRIFKSKARQG